MYFKPTRINRFIKPNNTLQLTSIHHDKNPPAQMYNVMYLLYYLLEQVVVGTWRMVHCADATVIDYGKSVRAFLVWSNKQSVVMTAVCATTPAISPIVRRYFIPEFRCWRTHHRKYPYCKQFDNISPTESTNHLVPVEVNMVYWRCQLATWHDANVFSLGDVIKFRR